MAKLLFLSAYQLLLYEALAGGADERLAAIGGKARKESAYHLDHAHCGRCGSATAPTSRTGGCRPRSTRSGRTSHELFAGDRRPGRPAPSLRAGLAVHGGRRCWPRRR